MRHALVGLLLMAASLVTTPAHSQVNVSIGINVPAYPSLVRIPNYPVYYAPSLQANYFFYDGLYWVFSGDSWYESPWYNGPWYAVDPYEVPVFLLRVPVRYYHARPSFFINTWAYDAPPHWGDHWGSSWESRHSGWDRWNRTSAPAAAPLPTYQRQYSGSRYPSVQQQAAIQTKSYSYTPRDNVARQRFEARRTEARAAPQQAQPQAQRTQQARVQQQERQQQARSQQQERAQQQQQARAQQDRAQQARAELNRQRAQEARAQPQRQERTQQAQAPRQEPRAERPQQAQRPQQAERQQQHENRGQEKEKDKGKGHDKD